MIVERHLELLAGKLQTFDKIPKKRSDKVNRADHPSKVQNLNDNIYCSNSIFFSSSLLLFLFACLAHISFTLQDSNLATLSGE